MNRLVLLFAVILAMLAACSPAPESTAGKTITVTVVYTDRDTINEEARRLGYTSQANGFYDPLGNRLWCPDEETPEAFRTCGHELRHVVKGEFHR